MKIKIITLVFVGTCGLLFGGINSLLEYDEPMALCIGDVRFHTDVDPDLICFYHRGNRVRVDIHYDKKSKRLGDVITKKELVKIVPYTLNEAKATQKIHLLICCRPHFASDSNTITYLHVPENVSYKFYTLTAARKYDEEGKAIGCMWAVSEEILPDGRIVPDNTIIFLFNADHIEGLEEKSWPLNSNIRLLPSIVMKKTIQPDDVAKAIIEARMIAIDFDTVHRYQIQNTTKIENKTVVTIKP